MKIDSSNGSKSFIDEAKPNPIYIYFFDSMSTRIREFRTIKSAEFYPCSKYILDPSLIPRRAIEQDEPMEGDCSVIK